MLIELFLLSTVFISMLIGCKKKNKAASLKPRDLDGKPNPSAGGTPLIKKSEAEAAKKEEPVEKEEKMAERPPDDNETINDAKSNWGAIPP